MSTRCLGPAPVLGQLEMVILAPGPAGKGRKRTLRYTCSALGEPRHRDHLIAEPGAPSFVILWNRRPGVSW